MAQEQPVTFARAFQLSNGPKWLCGSFTTFFTVFGWRGRYSPAHIILVNISSNPVSVRGIQNWTTARLVNRALLVNKARLVSKARSAYFGPERGF
jgi:hypothetical protein